MDCTILYRIWIWVHQLIKKLKAKTNIFANNYIKHKIPLHTIIRFFLCYRSMVHSTIKNFQIGSEGCFDLLLAVFLYALSIKWKIKEIKRKNNNFLDSVSYFGLRRKWLPYNDTNSNSSINDELKHHIQTLGEVWSSQDIHLILLHCGSLQWQTRIM